jgi:hypothetical protein
MARLDSAQRVKFSSMRQMGGGPPRGGGFGPPGGAPQGKVR